MQWHCFIERLHHLNVCCMRSSSRRYSSCCVLRVLHDVPCNVPDVLTAKLTLGKTAEPINGEDALRPSCASREVGPCRHVHNGLNIRSCDH
jgi:hypothetical protein